MILHEIVRILMQWSGAVFAGACLYIALAQHPVRMSQPVPRALEDFRAVIPRAEKLQAPLLIVCIAATAAHLLFLFSWTVVAGGLLLIAVLVQTIITVLPINKRLLSGEAEQHLAVAERLLTRWGKLHAARTALAVLGSLALLAGK